ncbi:MAG TPA: hypothetical protein VFT69_11815, partial [Pseudolabrys sp.]|nr:hypothetical protein [Pseudolabrys sp.]
FKYVILSADKKAIVIGHHTAMAGWVVDSTYSTRLSAGTDYKLGVKLKAGLVNVSLNGAVIASSVYNETVTMGGYGLLSLKGAKSGQTSFDIVEVKTDDTAYAAAPVLQVAAAPAPSDAGMVGTLDVSELSPILQEAKLLWTNALGAGDARLAALTDVNIEVTDLADGILGQTVGSTISIDTNAAGWGWFVDSSPQDNSEFQVRLPNGVYVANPSSPASEHMDLLSTVLHELGNVMGFAEDTGADVTGMILQAGVRRLPDFGVGPESTTTSSTPAPHAAPSFPASQLEVAPPVIRWDRAVPGVVPSGDGLTGGYYDWIWLDDFINHRGQGFGNRNPNAGIKIHLPMTTELR